MSGNTTTVFPAMATQTPMYMHASPSPEPTLFSSGMPSFVFVKTAPSVAPSYLPVPYESGSDLSTSSPSMYEDISVGVGGCNECECPEEEIEIRILAPSNFGFPDYLNTAAKEYESEHSNVKIKITNITIDDSKFRNELVAEAESKSDKYTGYIYQAQETGTLTDKDALWDLNDFVRTSEELVWPDLLSFYRERLAVYDDKNDVDDVKLIPLDGDLLLLYYRKDLFEEYNMTAPRTWDEYTSAAKFFHGKKIRDHSGNDISLLGNCVPRRKTCNLNAYWSRLVLFSMTQYQGSSSGGLFDTMGEKMEPLLGDAMVETLQHLANQVRFDSEGQFDGRCLQHSREMFQAGKCAMTYNWGNQVERWDDISLSVYDNFIKTTAVKRTPGSRKVYNRETLKLESCTMELCPYGVYEEGLGIVNYAPYAAFSGWAGSVNNNVDDRSKQETAKFIAYLSNEYNENQVQPSKTNDNAFQPYRLTQLDINEWDDYWKEGFARDFAINYTDALRVVDNGNTVIEDRFPDAYLVIDEFEIHVEPYLKDVYDGVADQGKGNRVEIAINLNESISTIVTDYGPELFEIYQRSLGAYQITVEDKSYIGDELRYVGYSACGLVMLLDVACVVWTIQEWRNRGTVVRASQPFLLLTMCLGIALMCFTVFPVSVDDSWASVDLCDVACIGAPWLYFTGFTLFFSAVFSKNWQNLHILANPDSPRSKRLKVSREDFCMHFTRFYAINVALLLAWTLLSPLEWKREILSETQIPGIQSIESYGMCRGDDWSAMFAGLIFAVNFAFLLFSLYMSFKCSKIKLQYDENKWTSLSFIGFCQIWGVSAPIFILLIKSAETKAYYMLQVGVIFTTSLAALALIFVPKFSYTRQNKEQILRIGTTNRSSGSVTPGSSFVSQTSTRSIGDNLNAFAIDEATRPQHQSPRRRSSFGIQVLSHPGKEPVELMKLKSRLEIHKIAIADATEKLDEAKRQLRALKATSYSFPGSDHVYMKPTISSATTANKAVTFGSGSTEESIDESRAYYSITG